MFCPLSRLQVPRHPQHAGLLDSSRCRPEQGHRKRTVWQGSGGGAGAESQTLPARGAAPVLFLPVGGMALSPTVHSSRTRGPGLPLAISLPDSSWSQGPRRGRGGALPQA